MKYQIPLHQLFNFAVVRSDDDHGRAYLVTRRFMSPPGTERQFQNNNPSLLDIRSFAPK